VRKHKYLESGERYSAQGKDREAAIQFSNALKIDKNFAEAHYDLAQAYLHMGALSAAYGELLRAATCSQPTTRRGSTWGICSWPGAGSTTPRRRPMP
jgi:Tfp pilus assembly protein PilF